MPVERREQVTRVEIVRVNGQPEELAGFGGRRQPSLGGTSRMNREIHVRICERLGVRFPGATRQMTKAPINLQDLRRRLYIKAKTEPTWRFWGLYVHVCKGETLQDAYRQAKANDGAPGVDGVTFAAVEAAGVEKLLDQLREELVPRTYRPQQARKVEIPKGGGSTSPKV